MEAVWNTPIGQVKARITQAGLRELRLPPRGRQVLRDVPRGQVTLLRMDEPQKPPAQAKRMMKTVDSITR